VLTMRNQSQNQLFDGKSEKIRVWRSEKNIFIENRDRYYDERVCGELATGAAPPGLAERGEVQQNARLTCQALSPYFLVELLAECCWQK
jgi:hypothetical protein